MAFIANKNQQISLNDSTFYLSERGLMFLKKSWAAGFSDPIFPKINEDRFAVLYSENPATHPITPVNVIIGMLILKELNNDTDD